MRQRYDDFAEWYDAYVSRGAGERIARSADHLLEALLGPGDDQLCLDLGRRLTRPVAWTVVAGRRQGSICGVRGAEILASAIDAPGQSRIRVTV